MDFHLTGSAGCKASSCSAFKLSRPARTILFLKSHDVPNPTTDGNNLDLLDLPDYLKVQGEFCITNCMILRTVCKPDPRGLLNFGFRRLAHHCDSTLL